MNLESLKRYFTETLLTRDLATWRSPFARGGVWLYRLVYHTLYGYDVHDSAVRSVALTFYTLMSLVPIVAVLFAIVKGFGLAGDLVQNLYALFPQNPEIVDYLVDFSDRALARTRGGVMAAVALVMLFWSVISVFSSIVDAFNHIWEVENRRSLARRMANYVAAILIVPLFWVIINAVSGYAGELFVDHDTWLYPLLTRLGAMSVVWILFTVLYLIIPDAEVRFTSALFAGIVAGTTFLLFQWGYIFCQRWMTSYNTIYGSFAALPLLLIWMRYSWSIMLFGGELSFAFQHLKSYTTARRAATICYDGHRKVMIAVMVATLRHFRSPGGPTPKEAIAAELALPLQLVEQAAGRLVKAGQLIRIGDHEKESYLPGYEIASMTLCGVLERVEACGDDFPAGSPSTALERVDREVERIKAAALVSKENTRLVDLL